jgi:hypothetical protein
MLQNMDIVAHQALKTKSYAQRITRNNSSNSQPLLGQPPQSLIKLSDAACQPHFEI